MINSFYFETERMIVRAWQPEDITGLYKVMSDVRVHTYTKDKNNPWDRERTEKYIRFMIEKDFKTLDNYHGAAGKCGIQKGVREDWDGVYRKSSVSRLRG